MSSFDRPLFGKNFSMRWDSPRGYMEFFITAPMVVTQERAREIVAQAQEKTVDGKRILSAPWADFLDYVTFPEEKAFILWVQDGLPGSPSYLDALLTLANSKEWT